MYDKQNYKLAEKFYINGKQTGNFNALRNQFQEEFIIQYMKILKYSDENFAIMAGDEIYLRRTHPELFLSDEWMDRRADGRSRLNYFQDLVAGWLFEDMITYTIKMQDKSLKVELNGSDSNREVLIKKVTNNSDYKISYNGKYLLVELSMSHTGFCYFKEGANLRNDKRKHLVEQEAFLLEVETFALSRTQYSPRFALIGREELNNYTKAIKWGKETNFVHIQQNQYFYTKYLSKVLIEKISEYGKIA